MKRIVLCGSMKLKEKIFEVEEYLKNKGYEVVTPKEFRVEMTKKDASKLHFDEIANKNTDIVLAVNITKKRNRKLYRAKHICRNSNGILF